MVGDLTTQPVEVQAAGRSDADRVLIVLADADAKTHVWLPPVSAAALESDVRVLALSRRDCWWTDRAEAGWNEQASAAAWLAAFTESITVPKAIVGLGAGGQGALLASFEQPTLFPVVAAIAPACDLGRWYGRSEPLAALFDSADQARQWEAPLRFNPLRRPKAIWVGCDPRDEPCVPSALRVVTKLTSSGVPVEYDLESQIGDSRADYFARSAATWVPFVAAGLDRVAIDLPLL